MFSYFYCSYIDQTLFTEKLLNPTQDTRKGENLQNMSPNIQR